MYLILHLLGLAEAHYSRLSHTIALIQSRIQICDFAPPN